MKKLMRSYLFQFLLVVAAVITMHSCSCHGDDTLEGKLDKVSDKAQVVSILNLEQLMDQTEITTNDKGEIEFPSYLTKLMSAFMSSGQLRQINKVKEFRGLDFTQVVFAGYDLDDSGEYDYEKDKFIKGSAFQMLIFNVKDEDDFIKSVKELDKTAWSGDNDGYTVVTTANSKGPKFLIKGSLAYMVDEDVTPKELEDKIDKAKETPLSEGKKEYLNREGNVIAAIVSGPIFDMLPKATRTPLTMAIDIDLSTAMLGISAKLDGPTVSANFALLDKEGKPAPLKVASPINPEILSFVNENDLLVGAIGISSLDYINRIPDSNGYAGQEIQGIKEMLKPFADFKEITVMFAAGLKTDKPVTDLGNFNDFRLTLALNSKSGDMNNLYGYVCDYMNAIEQESEGIETPEPVIGRPSRNYGDEYSVSFKVATSYDYYTDTYTYETFNLYTKKSGNTVVISNAPISKKGSKNFTTEDVKDKTSFLKVILPKDLPNLKGMKIPTGAIFTAYAGQTSESEFTLSLTGTDKKFIPAIAEMILNAGN